MKKYILILPMLLPVLLSGQALVTDRPDQTESSSTIEKGNLQIESGALIGFTGDNKSVTKRQLLAPSTLFRIGVLKGVEIRILNQLESVKNQENTKTDVGISDLEVGTKIQLFQKEDINSEIAFLSHLIIPTGSENLSNENFGTINKLSISHELRDNIGIGYNLGYNYFGSGKGNLTYSLAVGFGITEKASIYIEPYGDLVELEDYESNIDAGLTYLLNDNFQLDFSFGTGVNHNMNYVSFGFSWKMNRED